MEPKTPFTFYSIAGDCTETEVKILQHTVTQEQIDEFREETDAEDDYDLAIQILYEDIVSEYAVEFTPCIIVNEQQLLVIQKFKIE